MILEMTFKQRKGATARRSMSATTIKQEAVTVSLLSSDVEDDENSTTTRRWISATDS